MKYIYITIILLISNLPFHLLSAQIKCGAERMDLYIPDLESKSVVVMGNHTSYVNGTHLVDTLLSLNIKVQKIFCPEHGFRGDADAGEHVKNYIDKKTGIPVISLYGSRKKPKKEDLEGVDLILFDIQDVGVRFYTYISSMHYLMEACAENNIEFMVLDRPNPNGFYVDGPILEKKYKSFVGMHEVPLVHGMSIGEYAQMINGEKWLKDKMKCKLKVIPCEDYTHKDHYEVPIKPSPNLQTMQAIYLYPSLGFFEGTVFSAGRGTDFPFMCYGHPKYPNRGFSYKPRSIEGASKYPKFKGKKCFGKDLRLVAEKDLKSATQVNLEWIFDAYYSYPDKDKFFNNFFYKLAGTNKLRKAMEAGEMPDEIRKSWEPGLKKFMKIRKKYLLYEDF